MPSCLTLIIIRHGSKIKRNNSEKGVAPIEKGALGSPSTTVGQLTY